MSFMIEQTRSSMSCVTLAQGMCNKQCDSESGTASGVHTIKDSMFGLPVPQKV